MSPLRLLPWVLWLSLAAFSAITYDLLPADLPQHFNFSGEVTRTTARSPVSWGMLPAVALFTLALTQGIATRLPSNPELFNFPAKDKLLALPPAARAPVIAQMRTFMDITSLLVMIVMLGAQWMLWQSAQGGANSTSSTVLLVGCTALVPVLLLHVFRINAATERAHAEWLASQR